MSEQALMGKVATVVRAVRGGGLPGEIRVLDGGEPVLLMAFSEQPVDVGARVRIVHSRGSRQVDVAPWP